MLRPKSTISAVTSKIILLLLSYLFLVSAAIFGLVGSYRVDVLRTDLAKANAARDLAENRRVTQETEVKTRETAVAGAEAKIAEAENKVTKAETELLKLQNEKAELESKLDASRNEIASLQKRIGDAGRAAKPAENPGTRSTPEPVVKTTPPPARSKQQVMPIKATQVAGTVGTMSISSARALAIYAPRPEYPRQARSDSIAGSGVCVMSVDPRNGYVTEASIAQSTGNQILDNSAVSTFRTWIFKPRKVSTVSISFGFTTRRASY